MEVAGTTGARGSVSHKYPEQVSVQHQHCLAPILSKVFGKVAAVSVLFSLCFIVILMSIYLGQRVLTVSFLDFFFLLAVDPEEYSCVTSVHLMLGQWRSALYVSA